MCIAALAWNAHPRWHLVVAANRDEFHDRPAAPLSAWADGSGIIAGRDLKGGGTWLGVSEAARLVLITNYRAPGYPKPDRPSRGGLVTSLLGEADPLEVAISGYNPFNLLSVAASEAMVIANHPLDTRQSLSPGVYGLSNGALTPAWPKTEALRDALAGWLAADTGNFSPLFTALRNQNAIVSPAWDEGGPEPRLSSIFINDPTYGTRCSTVVAIDADGHGQITERRFDASGDVTDETALTFRWNAPQCQSA